MKNKADDKFNPMQTKHEFVYQWVLSSIQAQHFLPNQKLPSVRQLAKTFNFSNFTVATAYDNLIADGYIRAVKGVGYYVEKVYVSENHNHLQQNEVRTSDVSNSAWLMNHLFNQHPEHKYPGRGRLPSQWIPKQEFHSAVKKSLLTPSTLFSSYGSVHGLESLRKLFARNLNRVGITPNLDNIMTTAGVSGAIDLISDYLLKPGDTVLVDDPCWFWVIDCLRIKGVQVIGIERTKVGPNTRQLQLAASMYQPKLYITNTVLHNPTSFNVSPMIIHEVINLAKQYGFYILEDDSYSELSSNQENIRYASLNNELVFYCCSSSKIIGGNFKVGFLCSPKAHIDGLLNRKMLSQMCVAEMNERAILAICSSSHYRKHVEKIRAKLTFAHEDLARQIQSIGLTYSESTMSGLFLWQKLPCDAEALAIAAKKDGWLIAPGQLFSPNKQYSIYMRLNVALTSTMFLQWLETYLSKNV